MRNRVLATEQDRICAAQSRNQSLGGSRTARQTKRDLRRVSIVGRLYVQSSITADKEQELFTTVLKQTGTMQKRRSHYD